MLYPPSPFVTYLCGARLLHHTRHHGVTHCHLTRGISPGPLALWLRPDRGKRMLPAPLTLPPPLLPLLSLSLPLSLPLSPLLNDRGCTWRPALGCSPRSSPTRHGDMRLGLDCLRAPF